MKFTYWLNVMKWKFLDFEQDLLFSLQNSDLPANACWFMSVGVAFCQQSYYPWVGSLFTDSRLISVDQFFTNFICCKCSWCLQGKCSVTDENLLNIDLNLFYVNLESLTTTCYLTQKRCVCHIPVQWLLSGVTTLEWENFLCCDNIQLKLYLFILVWKIARHFCQFDITATFTNHILWLQRSIYISKCRGKW